MTAVNPRFPLFDSLRAIAALSIFVFHLPWFFQLSAESPLRPYLTQLNAGIAVFFLISGFLLYRPFALARYTGEPAPAFVPFALRRLLRIVPAYWVALTITVLVLTRASAVIPTEPVFSAKGIFYYFGFLQVYDSDTLLGGISAAWTLCVELTFYALLPLWAMLMRRFRSASPGGFLRTELLGLGGLFLIGLAWTSVAALNSTQSAAVFGDVTQIKPWLWVLPAYLDHFALGMALAVLSVVAAGRATVPRAVRVIDRAPWVPWLGAALAYFLLAQLLEWVPPEDLAARIIGTHELQAVFAFALLLPAVFGDPDRGAVRKLLANRALLWVGIVSYGVYLWHVAIIETVNDLGLLDLGLIGFGAIALAATLLVAAASFYVVERPALRIGRRISHRRRSQDAEMRLRDLGRHEQPQQSPP